ncbi:MAG TPA: hypothetical protein P5330_00830, partial [Candidatus Competibacteraceae bacterium]|nr:hypothetical protein [Candidatus Competibacteraceae bacterium]
MTTYSDVLVASDYVVCAILRKVADVFNVELLWERVRSDQEGVCLMEALKRHPRTPRARQRKETRYSQIIIRIPERDYIRDDRLEDSFGRRTLLRELRRLHEQELGRYLAEDAVIRYRVEPDTGLRPGEVQFLFGRAISIPADGETPLFRIDAATDGQSEWRQLGFIYPGQRLTLLNGDRRASSIAVQTWPFMSGESVLLMLRPGPPVTVDVVAEPPAYLTVTGDGSGRFLTRDRRGRGLRLWIAPLVADREAFIAQEPVIQQEPRSAQPKQKQREPVVAPKKETSESALESTKYVNLPNESYPRTDPWGRREPVFGIPFDLEKSSAPGEGEDKGDEPETPLESAAPSPSLPLPAPAGDQQTWIPRRPAASLQVSGVALQRLSTYATAGISDWRLSFNR